MSGTQQGKGDKVHTGGRVPVDSKVRAKVRRLAREGLSRNEVARRVGISTSTVSRICAAASPPITFDRTLIREAQEARTVDLKARRQAIAQGLLDDVDRLRTMLFEPVERTHMSVTLGEQKYMAAPAAGEIKDLLIGAGIALDKHVALVKHDSEGVDLTGLDAFLAMLAPGVRLPGDGEAA